MEDVVGGVCPRKDWHMSLTFATVSAFKEIILTTGAIDTSKLLLLSGLGPGNEPREFDIPVVLDLPGVGKNARDHLQVIMVHVMKRSFSGQFGSALDDVREATAGEEWTRSQTGPYTDFFGSAGLLYGKDEETYSTDAFRALGTETRKFISRSDVPNWEIVFVSTYNLP